MSKVAFLPVSGFEDYEMKVPPTLRSKMML